MENNRKRAAEEAEEENKSQVKQARVNQEEEDEPEVEQEEEEENPWSYPAAPPPPTPQEVLEAQQKLDRAVQTLRDLDSYEILINFKAFKWHASYLPDVSVCLSSTEISSRESARVTPDTTIDQLTRDVARRLGIAPDHVRLEDVVERPYSRWRKVAAGENPGNHWRALVELQGADTLADAVIGPGCTLAACPTPSFEDWLKTPEGMAFKERDEEMNIVVKTLTGKTIPIRTRLREEVCDFKVKIQDKEGIPPDQMRIIFVGVQMEDRWTLLECGLQDGSTVHLVLCIRGS